ncbi:bacteriocin family protein [Aminithiophilus ramosus]|uniref:Bacteriocin family protein n=2 Tax=Synergistales TaxID=649776 RepID=A0A9Q7ABP3_9BACT|nr:family 1 encapsulin nanocompartment shell protein [Aminithiophilus ramosus]QTX32073.1 bacteriocin family protein [Aminithiophilus ramosus]QVL35939.1 bacteriocin family protein [Synergistota bacterium]
MDILKRSLAPITASAWEEIDEQARRALKAHLSARRFVDVAGPKGWDYAAVPLGRLNMPENRCEGDVCFGVHAVQPLVEARVSFELDRWELDNIERGAKDPDLAPVVEAAVKMARFEEKAVFEGFERGCVVGLVEAGADQALDLSCETGATILAGLAQAVRRLQAGAVEGPYALVAGPALWDVLQTRSEGYPLRKRVESLVDEVILAPHFDGALVVSLRGGDFELVVGQDYSIGFEEASNGKVRFFLSESFTFRVIDPTAVVPFRIV